MRMSLPSLSLRMSLPDELDFDIHSSSTTNQSTPIDPSAATSQPTSYVVDHQAPPIDGLEEFKHVCTALLTLINILGVLLNSCVIGYSRRLRASTGDSTHAFVCSMAAGDLLVCSFAQPFEFVLHRLIVDELITDVPDWICRAQHGVYWLGYSASGVSLTLLNLDKLLFFKWPLHYGLVVGTKRASSISIALAWLICLGGSTVMVHPSVLLLSSAGDCSTLDISASLYIAYTSAYCILPVVSSAVVSVYLCTLVHRMRTHRRCLSQTQRCRQQQHRGRRRRNSSSGSSSTITSTTTAASAPSSTSSSLLSDYSIQQRLRAMAFIFITTAWTFVALTPFRVFNIVRVFRSHEWYADRDTLIAAHWSGYALLYLLSLNPAVDPCLTLLTYAPYKNLFIVRFSKIRQSIRIRIWGSKESTGGGGSTGMRSGRGVTGEGESQHTTLARCSLTQSEWV